MELSQCWITSRFRAILRMPWFFVHWPFRISLTRYNLENRLDCHYFSMLLKSRIIILILKFKIDIFFKTFFLLSFKFNVMAKTASNVSFQLIYSFFEWCIFLTQLLYANYSSIIFFDILTEKSRPFSPDWTFYFDTLIK